MQDIRSLTKNVWWIQCVNLEQNQKSKTNIRDDPFSGPSRAVMWNASSAVMWNAKVARFSHKSRSLYFSPFPFSHLAAQNVIFFVGAILRHFCIVMFSPNPSKLTYLWDSVDFFRFFVEKNRNSWVVKMWGLSIIGAKIQIHELYQIKHFRLVSLEKKKNDADTQFFEQRLLHLEFKKNIYRASVNLWKVEFEWNVQQSMDNMDMDHFQINEAKYFYF